MEAVKYTKHDRSHARVYSNLALHRPSIGCQATYNYRCCSFKVSKFQNCSRKTMLVARRYRRAIPFCRMDFPRQRRETILLAGHRRLNVSLPKNDRTTETRVTTERTNRMAVYSQASYTHRVRTRCVDGCQLLFTILDSIAKGQRSNAACISQRERNLSNAIYRNERSRITFRVGP